MIECFGSSGWWYATLWMSERLERWVASNRDAAQAMGLEITVGCDSIGGPHGLGWLAITPADQTPEPFLDWYTRARQPVLDLDNSRAPVPSLEKIVECFRATDLWEANMWTSERLDRWVAANSDAAHSMGLRISLRQEPAQEACGTCWLEITTISGRKP